VGSTTIFTRVQKMIKNGTIKRFTVELDCSLVGFPACKWVGISVEPGRIDEIAEKIANYDEARLVATTDGDHDIVIEIIGHDEREIGKFINQKIKSLEGVKSGIGMIHSSSFTKIFKHTHKVPILIKESET
nr:Lrp/AsnC family transcriptional regulator [Candidatus Methanofastidiosa archaeon]